MCTHLRNSYLYFQFDCRTIQFLLNLIYSILGSPFFHAPNPGSQACRRWQNIPQLLICFILSHTRNRTTIQNLSPLCTCRELSQGGAPTGHFRELAGWRPLWSPLRPRHRPLALATTGLGQTPSRSSCSSGVGLCALWGALPSPASPGTQADIPQTLKLLVVCPACIWELGTLHRLTAANVHQF